MKNILKKLLIILPVVLLFSIPVYAETTLLGVKVRHDRKFDFNQLSHNYQWIKRKDSSREYYASTDPDINEYFLSVVNRNLAEKGFQQAFDGSASFGIDYEVVIKKEGKQDSLEKTLADYRQKRYSRSHIPQLPNIKNMKAGSIILNIMDMETGYLIWIGHAEAVVVEKKNREKLINQFVTKMLAEFPPK
jgi:hypothetical protein